MEKEIETAVVITLNADGTFTAHLEQPEEPFKVARVANVQDLTTLSRMVVKEIDDQQLVARIANAIVEMLTPPVEQTVPDKVKEKLKERNITPEE
jgi:hypothetical protein